MAAIKTQKTRNIYIFIIFDSVHVEKGACGRYRKMERSNDYRTKSLIMYTYMHTYVYTYIYICMYIYIHVGGHLLGREFQKVNG